LVIVTFFCEFELSGTESKGSANTAKPTLNDRITILGDVFENGYRRAKENDHFWKRKLCLPKTFLGVFGRALDESGDPSVNHFDIECTFKINFFRTADSRKLLNCDVF